MLTYNAFGVLLSAYERWNAGAGGGGGGGGGKHGGGGGGADGAAWEAQKLYGQLIDLRGAHSREVSTYADVC
jgi:hypothetical protein